MTADRGRPELNLYALVGIGTLNLGTLVLGLGIGWFIDGRIGTFPVVTLVVLMVGIAAGPMSVGATAAAMAPSSGVMTAVNDAAMEHPPCCPEERTKPVEGCRTACMLSSICSAPMPACENKADGWKVELSASELAHPVAQESRLPSALVEPPSRPPRA